MKCQCGRETKPVHCVSCGRLDVYAIQRASKVIELDGQKFLVKGFRCRKCGLEFDETSPCEAPPRRSMKEVRAALKVSEEIAALPFDEKRKLAFAAIAKLKPEVKTP